MRVGMRALLTRVLLVSEREARVTTGLVVPVTPVSVYVRAER